jgi:hypothetical protein
MNSLIVASLLDTLEDLYLDKYYDDAHLYLLFSRESKFWRIQNNKGIGVGDGDTIIEAFNDYEQNLLAWDNFNPDL